LNWKWVYHDNKIDKTLAYSINLVLFKKKGVIKIVDEERHYDFQLNNTESVIVETDREEEEEEVLEKIQRGFESQYNQYGKIKKEDISYLD
jgi:predicted 3-demethylubiquinone-9 3-methyltransferase (glyoxalase superfamily)